MEGCRVEELKSEGPRVEGVEGVSVFSDSAGLQLLNFAATELTSADCTV